MQVSSFHQKYYITYKVLRNPPAFITTLLAWVPESDVLRYFDHNITKEESEQLKFFNNGVNILYTKAELERMCCDLKIYVASNTSKHEFVKCFSERNNETPPELPILYNGSLQSVPSTIPLISKLSVRVFRAVLHTHGLLSCGNELAIKVYLLKKEN